MKFTAVIEQTSNYRKRMKYIPESNSFVETEYDCLMYLRNVKQPYGWIKESGTPPEKHLDIYIMSDREFTLGEEVEAEIIGVFFRTDGDHKFVGVLNDREITDFSQLEESEKEDLKRLYGGKYSGEGWYGREKAEEVLREYFESGEYR